MCQLRTGSPIRETRAACFDLLLPIHGRQSGITGRCARGSSGCAFEIARPGCRRERHSAGTGECARTQRLGQRSERRGQRGQSAGDTATSTHASYPVRGVPACRLANLAGAPSGQDQTDAICGIQIPRRGQGNGAGARQEDRRQDDRRQGSEHLQGMLNSRAGSDAAGIEAARLLITSSPSPRKRGEVILNSRWPIQPEGYPAHSSGFRPASIWARRGSRNGGSASFSPSVSKGSSVAKPGPSVAISNRMPFGSRK
jgi:hypothetical protein